MIVCLAANPSIDRLFGVDRLAPGGIHRPAEFAQVAGGKGLNVARAASALGADVRAVALLGGHAGRWIAEQCERDGIDLVAAWAGAETRSSLSVAVDDHGLTEFYEHGAAVTLEEWAGFAELAARHLPQAGWATMSGSLPPGAPADGYLPLIRVARTAFDSREEGIAARPAVVKLNAEEARARDRHGRCARRGADAARGLRRRGDRHPRPRRRGHGGAGRERAERRCRGRGPLPGGKRRRVPGGAGGGARRRGRLGRRAARGDRRRARPTPSSPARVGSTPSAHGRSRTRCGSSPAG